MPAGRHEGSREEEDGGCCYPEGLWRGPSVHPPGQPSCPGMGPSGPQTDVVTSVMSGHGFWIHSLEGLLPGALGGLSLRWPVSVTHVCLSQLHPAPPPCWPTGAGTVELGVGLVPSLSPCSLPL